MLRTARRRTDIAPRALRDGYELIRRLAVDHHADVVETRIGGVPVLCLHGAAAAEEFYDHERFRRRDAMPRRVRSTLLGHHGVQVLDGDEHRQRKALLLSLTTGTAVEDLRQRIAAEWGRRIAEWSDGREIVLREAAATLLCRAVCDWAGVPLAADEEERRARDLLAIIDAPAAVGPRHWRGRLARRRAERWAAGLVEDVRAGRLLVDEGRPLAVLAGAEVDGRLLALDAAADDLLNLIRPTVAVANYVVWVAIALQEHPEWRQRVADGDADEVHRFVQEVRRLSPFFPVVGARANRDLRLGDVDVPEGRLVILDLYGTSRDPAAWSHPDRFDPDRFHHRAPTAYDVVPQGGGDHERHHRCAGEWITIAAMEEAAIALTRRMRCSIPTQDLRVDLRRVPAIPRSGFVIADVRPR